MSISNIHSASEDSGCGLLLYRIYEEYHINLSECSMYGCCYITYSLAGIKQNSYPERI